MNKIHMLDESLARKIAAGEVIEKPVSVVKELVENSIDAGSCRISIHILQGGKSGIIVEDDGGGIEKDQLELAVRQHATSKISREKDLDSLVTLGYRGEALSSISSVSRLEIRSRTADSPKGALLTAGPEKDSLMVREINCTFGTRVQVEDLFFNMPARRKFLATSRSEFGRISRLIKDFAIIYPEIDFTLTHDSRKSYSSVNSSTREEVLRGQWGNEPDTEKANWQEKDILFEAWFQPFPGRKLNLRTFVNGRVIRDPVIRSSVNASDAGLSGNLAVFLSLNPEEVDVNIHPAKAEVRFRKSGNVFDCVRHGIEEMTGSRKKMGFSLPADRSFSFPGPDNTEKLNFPAAAGTRGEGAFYSFNSRVGSPEKLFEAEKHLKKEEIYSDEFEGRYTNSEISFIGQLDAGYLIYEKEDCILLMDLHAAHERINFEKIKNEFSLSGGSQILANEETVPPSLAEYVQEYQETLSEIGFVFENIGGALCMKEVPVFVQNISLGALEVIRTIIMEMDEKGTLDSGSKNALWLKWANMACKRSIKLTSRISSPEAMELYRKLLECDNPLSCPHGRPTMLSIEISKLGRMFGRD